MHLSFACGISTNLLLTQQLNILQFAIVWQPRSNDDVLLGHIEQREGALRLNWEGDK